MRTLLKTLLLLSLSGAAASGGEALPRADWKCTALDGEHLVLTGDYSEVRQRLFEERLAERLARNRGQLPEWAVEYRFWISAVEAIMACRPAVVGMFRDEPEIGIISDAGEALAVAGTGYWMNPIGLARFTDGEGMVRLAKHSADVSHHLFLKFSRPLKDGERVVITLPAGEVIEFVRRPEIPSPLFKINQVGYMPRAVKYAYLGAWLGTAGPMRLRHLDGVEFQIRDAESGEKVFSGALESRPDDPVNPDGAPFTGEEVLEADFSGLTRPGSYFIQVDGVGRSEVFNISDRTMAEAFYVHIRGLYHQRCGIAKEPPYTNWVRRACHTECIRGTFPPDISHYNAGAADRRYGFRTADGKSATVGHFRLIADNPPREREVLRGGGGWHDAADFDRRPQHMGISGELAAVYLMKPENFIDGQLNIPESGNGVPDILDEAIWGLEHLRRMQQSDGGVGTWVETTRHPRPEDGDAASDTLTYYLSCATRAGSMEYAAYASCLALALRRAGADERSKEFAESARRAWAFAMTEGRVRPRSYHVDGKVVFYREAPAPAPEFVVKAGLNLFLLLDDPAFMHAAEANAEAAGEVMRRKSWSWSPLFWMEMELFDYQSEALDRLRAARRRGLIDDADKMLRQQERCYPYRVPWFGVDEGWAHTMSWGTFHPLRRARAFIAAHALTGEVKYLNGAYLANDFQNGANPSGSSLTSGLGRVYPVCFLDINSEAGGRMEFTPGISPFRNTYGIHRNAVKMAYGLFYSANPDQKFSGVARSLLPEGGLDEAGCAAALGRMLPVWRRWCNIEEETVEVSEFSVWETVAPAAVVTGYLLNGPQLPDPEWVARAPAADFRTLPGYNPLP